MNVRTATETARAAAAIAFVKSEVAAYEMPAHMKDAATAALAALPGVASFWNEIVTKYNDRTATDHTMSLIEAIITGDKARHPIHNVVADLRAALAAA